MKRGNLFFIILLFAFLLINISFVSAAILFESDWSTGEGTRDPTSQSCSDPDNAEICDINKALPWDTHSGNGKLNEVVVSAGLDFPTTNVYHSVAEYSGTPYPGQSTYTDQMRMTYTNNRWPSPDVGESLYYRWYQRYSVPDWVATNDSATPHTVQDGPAAGSMNWMWETPIWTNNSWQPQFNFANGNSYPNNRWRGPYLNKNQTYRIEFQVYRDSTTTFIPHIRIYNSADTLVADDDDIKNAAGGGGSNATFANNISLNIANVAYFSGFQMGNNGPNWNITSEQFPFTLWYHGGACIRDDTWCGPYNNTNQSQQQNDTTPAVRSVGLPSGLLPYNTTQTILSLTTNEAATCRYGTTANTAYSSIANTFITTGTTTHSQLVSGLTFNTTYNYYVRCNDTSNNLNTNDYTITFRISHGPNFTYNWNDWYTNETINFSLYNATYLQNISNVKFVNQYGRIQFLQNLNLSSDLNLAERIKVLDKKIWINSSLIPQFNKSAQLTFTGVGFSNPIIKIDGVDCPETKCQNITFDEATGTYVFNVTSFSVYEIVEQCEDNVKNYDETGKDCGGKCGECKSNWWVWVVVIVLILGILFYVFRKKK